MQTNHNISYIVLLNLHIQIRWFEISVEWRWTYKRTKMKNGWQCDSAQNRMSEGLRCFADQELFQQEACFSGECRLNLVVLFLRHQHFCLINNGSQWVVGAKTLHQLSEWLLSELLYWRKGVNEFNLGIDPHLQWAEIAHLYGSFIRSDLYLFSGFISLRRAWNEMSYILVLLAGSWNRPWYYLLFICSI